MITIKNKTILVIIFIFFLINILLIVKRRNFNFYNFKLFLQEEYYSEINKDLSELKKLKNYNDIIGIKNFLLEKNIREVNFDKDVIKNLNLNFNEIIFFYYPLKIEDKSHYIISNFYNSKYENCQSLFNKPPVFPAMDINTNLTIYLCK